MTLLGIPISHCLGLLVVTAPLLLLMMLGFMSLLGRPLSEGTTVRAVQVAIISGLMAAMGVLAIMLYTGERHVPIEIGNWVKMEHFHFSIKFVFDRLSVPFVVLTFLLCGTIAAFASRYLHREPGYNRFFSLLSVFVLGMVVTSLAGTIETLFAGWELVGISSALLVAFFQERAAPVRSGLHVWVIYRISDAALLVAAVFLHHLTGEGDFDKLMQQGWPEGVASITHTEALIVGLLLLVAAAGKSALVPFSGWLPRAMEGPTPSSAVFYGALSVHLGAFLLLRVSPVLEASPALCVVIVVLGLLTALLAGLTSRVQADIKSALSYASLTQVGLIVAEIGLGFRYLALVHILGHAFLRTLQFLRAPTLLMDYHQLENATGTRLASGSSAARPFIPMGLQLWLFRLGMERGYLDSILKTFFADPFMKLFTTCDTLERRWTDFLAGGRSRESDALPPGAGTLEDMR